MLVPATDRDIVPGAKVRVAYHRRAKCGDAVAYGTMKYYGTITDRPRAPWTRAGGRKFYVAHPAVAAPLLAELGDYGDEVWVEVDPAERIRSFVAARKRWYRSPQAMMVGAPLVGGPYAGQEWLRDIAHRHSIEFEVTTEVEGKGPTRWRGHYGADGCWVDGGSLWA